MKQPTIISSITESSTEGPVIGLSFPELGKRISLNVNDLNEEIRQKAMLLRLKQKLLDAAAIARNPETGRSASPEEKYLAVKDVVEALVEGIWDRKGTGGGGVLLDALCEFYPQKSREELKEWLKGKSEKEKAQLRVSARLKPIVERLSMSKEKAAIGDELLGELDVE